MDKFRWISIAMIFILSACLETEPAKIMNKELIPEHYEQEEVWHSNIQWTYGYNFVTKTWGWKTVDRGRYEMENVKHIARYYFYLQRKEDEWKREVSRIVYNDYEIGELWPRLESK